MICAGCGGDLGRPERARSRIESRAVQPAGLATIGRRDTCPRCGVDLRCCRQCRFHDPTLADACREPQAERIVDKTRGNFCDFFAPAESAPVAAPTGAASARAALDRLFSRR